jgi:hypothetical protein
MAEMSDPYREMVEDLVSLLRKAAKPLALISGAC